MSSGRGRSPCDTGPRELRLDATCPGTLAAPSRRNDGSGSECPALTVPPNAQTYEGNVAAPGRALEVAVSPIRAKLEMRITGPEDAMTGKKPKEQMRKGKGIQPTTAQGPRPRITPETANPAPRSPKESKEG